MTDLAARIELLERPPVLPSEAGWEHSLSKGAPGIMLFHVERARTGDGDLEPVHAWARATTRKPVYADPGTGLFHGAPAVAFALHMADQPGYARALRTLDQAIVRLTRRRLDDARARIQRQELPELGEFDLISGLTGIGCYLLHRHPQLPEFRAILSYLVDLTEPLHVGGAVLPGWWTHSSPSGEPSDEFPGGHGNLGMAHGITGPLALLALAMTRGITVAGHAEAIGRICAWLDAWRQTGKAGTWWPSWITRVELRDGRCTQQGPFRPSWCYGIPGQARAQQLVGQALGDAERQRTAVQALTDCVADPEQLGQLDDAGLCHGWAGLLQTVWRTAADAQAPELNKAIPHLREQVKRRMQPGTKTGLLEGYAGQLLALLTATTDARPRPRWDTCLLIAREDAP